MTICFFGLERLKNVSKEIADLYKKHLYFSSFSE